MAGKKDYCMVEPMSPKDETIVKFRVIEMVEEMGVCIDEVIGVFQEAISLSTIVIDNELGISGWKEDCLNKDFNKKKVQEVLDYGKYLNMQLFMVKQHLGFRPEHPFAPSATPWRYQQFLKHARLWYLKEAKDMARQMHMDYLMAWSGPPVVVNEYCCRWP